MDLRSLCDWDSEFVRWEEPLKAEKAGRELSCETAELESLSAVRTLLVELKSISSRSSLDLELYSREKKCNYVRYLISLTQTKLSLHTK